MSEHGRSVGSIPCWCKFFIFVCSHLGWIKGLLNTHYKCFQVHTRLLMTIKCIIENMFQIWVKNMSSSHVLKKLMSKSYSTVECNSNTSCFKKNGQVLREKKPEQIWGT